MKQQEYKDKVFIITIPEGGELKDARVEYFNGFAVMGDTHPSQPIRFFAQVIGFQDVRAPMRTWGYGLIEFRQNLTKVKIKLSDLWIKLKEQYKL